MYENLYPEIRIHRRTSDTPALNVPIVRYSCTVNTTIPTDSSINSHLLICMKICIQIIIYTQRAEIVECISISARRVYINISTALLQKSLHIECISMCRDIEIHVQSISQQQDAHVHSISQYSKIRLWIRIHLYTSHQYSVIHLHWIWSKIHVHSIFKDSSMNLHSFIQPVPEKMRLEMAVGMQTKIFHSHPRLLFERLIWKEKWTLTIEDFDLPFASISSRIFPGTGCIRRIASMLSDSFILSIIKNSCALNVSISRYSSTPNMGWLWLVGSFKLYLSFAEYRLFYRALLQKRPIILRSLLSIATPYPDIHPHLMPQDPEIHPCIHSCLYVSTSISRHAYTLHIRTNSSTLNISVSRPSCTVKIPRSRESSANLYLLICININISVLRRSCPVNIPRSRESSVNSYLLICININISVLRRSCISQYL